MERIRVLSAEVAQLIAAGEVVERPASVIKELVENAIDAGATVIRVDIEGGGVRLMRVSDNGCGMNETDAKNCFLRHATSKISSASDINGVITLGFRGEALASIAAVSRVKLVTKTKDAVEGTCVVMSGGVFDLCEPIGAADGTTIAIEDLFYNTPARKKFLKSERAETGAISGLIDRLALSHPEISFRYYNNGKEELFTPGDDNITSAAASVLGKETARNMIEVEPQQGIAVEGLISRPLACRGNRNQQFFFINGRCVTSGLLSKALESAYAGSIMTGKYPICILRLTIDPTQIDVNVHPSKSIVKFTDEKPIFSAVHSAVSQALSQMDQRHVAVSSFMPKQEQQKIVQGFYDTPVKQPTLDAAVIVETESKKEDHAFEYVYHKPRNTVLTFSDRIPMKMPKTSPAQPIVPKQNVPAFKVESEVEINEEVAPQVVLIGEIFNTYIIAQCGDEVYFIDKHAAHERLIYEKLKNESESTKQPLLIDLVLTLTRSDKESILEQMDYFASCGFEMEDYGGNALMVRAIPTELSVNDVLEVLEQAVSSLNDHHNAKDKKTRILEVMACKAAVKGGQISSREEHEKLLDRLFSLPDVKYCPHGRPIIYTMTKKDFEKMFKRIVS